MHNSCPVIHVVDLSVERDNTILNRVNWQVNPGQNWVILGANGSGKTSLLNALTAYMARETSKSFTATQFALFSSFIAVPRIFANASTGFIIEAVGYTQFFIICTLLAIPGMLLLFKVAPWNEKS